ncbi:probable LRR receptor-like serine/threonine-protein kinase At3g47570 isoform X1 [Gossypium raimondii]|uniref:probable LRR receptor-like serine/threonine-protein kinase At3g47570 isoform X1 n=1 Tax=Gossypium raimondii TaxID=29730 RepID=UPI00063AE3CD|nr:probable LRR receptor-like serine/threonine-protein kinase At3g47570 isoform X1 [Gossypium raimondii]XP_052485935.1 probable LRR receptor-like serine/threonine-protein kinase At3g47570 isoform X1 [Gossypium raimondii]XP_052485936.1 probable LRR receptor-like serine/threonine-protein kinase At3g47570 isoform X1 [Gossypium raimondii]
MNYNTCFHLLLGLFIPCSVVCLAMTTRNLNSDQFVLLEFKDRIADPQNVLANNWTASTSVCNWIGVSCGILHKRVIALNLTSMNLRGTIPPHLGNLSFLLSLDLSSNNLSGHLPKELGQLHRLRIIQLSYNGLNGEIPAWLGNLQRVQRLEMENNSFTGTIPQTLVNMSNLEILNLQFNQLSGQVPYSIFRISSMKIISLFSNSLSGSLPNDMCQHLPKLEVLYLSRNELSGNVPSSIGKCNNLQILALSYNQFTGIIPRGIGNLTRLEELYLRMNNLEGQIPTAIFNISSLKTIFLSNNSLSSSLPNALCHHCPMLEWLFLEHNELSGDIPSSMGECYKLQSLNLAANQFSGLIPKSIFNSTMLQGIYLNDNSLEGNLPPITNAPKLENLLLWGNNLSGNIPNSISNVSMLKELDLGNNLFSGPIPKTLGNLRYLECLHIQNNKLIAGSAIDHDWTFLYSLANCKHLKRIIVSGNPLSGVLPTYIGNLSNSLRDFVASNCEIMGNIPTEIGNLSNMLRLELDYNKLSGFIPTSIRGLQKLQGLDLSSNKLEGPISESLCDLESLYKLFLGLNKLYGSIPSCLGNIYSLGYLYLNSNKLSSAIPSTLWNLKDILEIDLSSNHLHNSHAIDVGNLRSLGKLNLSRNLLMGDILSTFGSLQTLVTLDLSNNKLHGHIPESFGGLINLESLDLCKNNLSGVISKSLEKLLHLKYFNVSFNRLEGEIPTEGSFSNFSSTSFMKNYALCGPPRLLVPPCKNDIHENSEKIILHALRYGLPTIGVVVLLIVLTIMYRRCQRRSTTLPIKDDLLSLKTPRRISHAELSRATNGFEESNMLGSGSFGYVYKGRLSDGMEVAIKVFNLQTEGAFRSFDIECDAMSNIVHRNIVKVITCCSSVDFKALVLGYMSNGNLEKLLHSKNHFLDIIQRVDIMIDVASAIEHLHNGHPTPIIHCDLKPNNILLDEDMVAHVGDFGIAKLLGEGDLMKHTMTLATIGYMAPEFGSAGIVSVKCDVYSYGIVLIETFTKKKPTDNFFAEERTIRHWMESSLPKGAIEIADVDLLKREDEYFIVKANCISSIMELALNCSTELPEERKDMKDVVAELKKIKQRLLNNIKHV